MEADERIAILADDFTGAGDSGVHFSLSGRRTALLLDRASLTDIFSDHRAVAVSTESRFLEPAEAAGAVAAAIGDCRAAGVTRFYKKVDSTLRGNIGAEVEAALAAGDWSAALVCTAMPKTGRAIRDGILYLRGVPIAETELGRDPFNPVPTSQVAEMLAAQTALPVARLPLSTVRSPAALRDAVAKALAAGARLLVADAVEDGDLAALGALLRTSPALLPVGAGGLAEGFVGPAAKPPSGGVDGRVLAIVGSLNPTSIEQARLAAESGRFYPLDLDMRAALKDAEDEIGRLAAEAEKADTAGLLLKNKITNPGDDGEISRDDGLRAAEIFGRAALALCRAAGCRALYVTGGSTAVAVAGALGVAGLSLEREFMPGVVLGSCQSPLSPVRWFITKAGGFGDAETLVRLAELLEAGRQDKGEEKQ